MEATTLRILHVWDQGINYLLARGLKPLGFDVDCIHRAEFDPFNMTPPEWKRTYPYGRWDGRVYGLHVLLKSLKYSLIHVHSFDKCVPTLSLFAPVVLHYHGSDIRGRWEDKKKYWRWAKRVLVSTTDLLNEAPNGTTYFPNPIDTNIFHPMNLKREPAALHFNYGALDFAQRIAYERSLRLVVIDKGVPYAEMPEIFNRYTHYVDVKRDHSDRVLISRPTDTGSLIGLQALASGCTVLTLMGERRGLPPEHEPENVAAKLAKIYEEVLQ